MTKTKEKKEGKKVEKTKRKVNKKVLIVGGILGLAIVVLAIVLFIILGNKGKTADDIEVTELNYVEVFSEANEAKAAKVIKDNLVRITNTIDENTNVIGTGFFIKDGYLITNSHVVDILGEVEIEYADGKKADAYLYANSVEYDIALLKVENVHVKALSFGSSNDMEVTNNVLAAGYIYNFR